MSVLALQFDFRFLMIRRRLKWRSDGHRTQKCDAFGPTDAHCIRGRQECLQAPFAGKLGRSDLPLRASAYAVL